jgi:hypothetical protein
MTNPFAILTLHAIHSYQKALGELSSNQESLIPKLLIYTIGTTLLATVIYKSVKKSNAAPPAYNFLYIISLPFKYLFYKFQCRRSPSLPSLPSLPEKPTLFENKYFNEYDEWINATDTEKTTDDHKTECLENMYYSTVRETINEFYGDVIMCYDHKTLSFAYYARTGNIPYKYLETISRKYMIETNAPKEIHVDIRNEYKKAVTTATTAATTTATTTATATATTATATDTATDTDTATAATEPETNVFVKLKSYNTVSNLKIHTNTNTNDTTSNNKDSFVKPETKTKTNIILRENANRYSYRGKIDDFAEHHALFLVERRTATAATATAATAATSTTGYAEFKKKYSAL